jgi:hypothetical protein
MTFSFLDGVAMHHASRFRESQEGSQALLNGSGLSAFERSNNVATRDDAD